MLNQQKKWKEDKILNNKMNLIEQSISITVQ